MKRWRRRSPRVTAGAGPIPYREPADPTGGKQRAAAPSVFLQWNNYKTEYREKQPDRPR
jgi:hypothetical protein